MLRYSTLSSIFLLSAALASTPLLKAQTSANQPQQAFVTVAFNAAVLQTAQAQHDFSDLQTRFAPRQSHLQTLNAEVETLKKQLNDSTSKLTEADRNAKLRTLETEQRQLEREADDYKADTEAASQQAFQSNAQKLYTFLQDYAKQHAYAMVIDRGSDATPVVWYAAAGVDITDQLVKAFNLQAAVASPSTNRLPSAPGATPH